mmetsp:Transcript_10329/g.14607  ORF Transcript_10329/g.14607 Transcript_10329/m.14607 type:complete len:589 (+) Transcript_10329:102-1868(+)
MRSTHSSGYPDYNSIQKAKYETKTDIKNKILETAVVKTERDPLLPPPALSSYTLSTGTIRERRKSPSMPTQENHSQQNIHSQHSHQGQMVMQSDRSQSFPGTRSDPSSFPQIPISSEQRLSADSSSYEIYTDNDSSTRAGRSQRRARRQSRRRRSNGRRNGADNLHQYYNDRANRIFSGAQSEGESSLLDVPEEIIAVRRAALTVFDPLTYTWLIVSVGFSLAMALGMSKWVLLLPKLRFWVILLPCWLSHFGLFICHIMSARALTRFVSEASDNRERQSSTDALDRTEYLPLLQRSLKFFLKTVFISIGVFIFEILLYFLIAKGTVSISKALTPLWLLVFGGIFDGIICKNQHITRLFSWGLALTFMILLVLRIDHNNKFDLGWRAIIAPVIALLVISTGVLTRIMYGHQIGYFRLTRYQRTAGIFYAFGNLGSIIVLIILVEVQLVRPIDIQMRLFLVALSSLTVSLVGFGAFCVTRDEFERLLRHGGQAAVLPKDLRFEPSGWTAVESRGIAHIPMFGEVCYEPLQAHEKSCDVMMCCSCYAYQEEDPPALLHSRSGDHPYLHPQSSFGMSRTMTTTSSIEGRIT